MSERTLIKRRHLVNALTILANENRNGATVLYVGRVYAILDTVVRQRIRLEAASIPTIIPTEADWMRRHDIF